MRLIPKKSSDIVELKSFLIREYGNPIVLPPPSPQNVFWWKHGNTSIWAHINEGIILIGDQASLIQKVAQEKTASNNIEKIDNDKLVTEPDGFRGIKWGTSIYKLNDLKFIRNDQSYGGMKVYIRPSDKLEIGSAKLQTVEYFFWKDRFCSVMVKTIGESNFYSLKDSVFIKYGPAYKSNQFSESYIWPKLKVTGIMLSLEPITEKGLLMLSSVTIVNEQQQFEKIKNKEGAEKGF